jgi:hypothetical protein
MRTIIVIGVAFLTVVLVIFAAFFSGMYESRTDMGDGYTYVEVFSGAHVISDPDHNVIVLQNVSDYSADENYIIGFRERIDQDIEYPEGHDQDYGYFVYSKRDKQLRIGLSENALKNLLKSENIDLELQ